MLNPEEIRKAMHEVTKCPGCPVCRPSIQSAPQHGGDSPAPHLPCGRTMLQALAKELRCKANRIDALVRALPVEISEAANLGLVDLVVDGRI